MTIIAEYEYRDPETGKLIATKVRREPKTFEWRQASGEEGLGELTERDLPLYHAEQLAFFDLDKLILFVEGEKAADALGEKLGVLAVCLPGGAATRPTTLQLSVLRGRKVAIWPDKDGPGRALMRRVFEKLRGIADRLGSVYPEDVPAKGDPYDWLQLGHTREDLIAEWKRKPLDVLLAKQLSVLDLEGREPKEIEWLWSQYLPKRMLTMIEGQKGMGKSWLTLKLAAMISTGDLDFPVFPQAHAPAKTLLLSHEDPVDEVIVPRLIALGADMSNVKVLSSVVDNETGGEEWFDLKKHIELLENHLMQDNYDLLVIDPVNNYIGASIDTYRDSDVRSVLSPLAALAARTGVCIIGIRHFKKGEGKLSEMGVGSVAYGAVARVVHALVPDVDALLVRKERRDDTPVPNVLLPVATNLTVFPKGVAFRLVDEGVSVAFRWDGLRDYTPDEYVAALRESKHTGAARHERKLRELDELLRTARGRALSDGEVAAELEIGTSVVELFRYRLSERKEDELGSVY